MNRLLRQRRTRKGMSVIGAIVIAGSFVGCASDDWRSADSDRYDDDTYVDRKSDQRQYYDREADVRTDRNAEARWDDADDTAQARIDRQNQREYYERDAKYHRVDSNKTFRTDDRDAQARDAQARRADRGDIPSDFDQLPAGYVYRWNEQTDRWERVGQTEQVQGENTDDSWWTQDGQRGVLATPRSDRADQRDNQRADADGQQRIRLTVGEVSKAQPQQAQRDHQYLQVTDANSQFKVLVDLGTKLDAAKINANRGDRMIIIGQAKEQNGQTVIMADRIVIADVKSFDVQAGEETELKQAVLRDRLRADGTVDRAQQDRQDRTDRGQRDQQHQGVFATPRTDGREMQMRIRESKKLTEWQDAQAGHTYMQVTGDDGKKVVIDLGPQFQADQLNFKKDTEVMITGQQRQQGDQTVINAERIVIAQVYDVKQQRQQQNQQGQDADDANERLNDRSDLRDNNQDQNDSNN